MWGRNSLVDGFFCEDRQIGWKVPKFSDVLVLDPKASEASYASEARHARSEATRLVTVICTSHRRKTAGDTD